MCGLNAIFGYHPAAPAPADHELIDTRDHMAARGPDGKGIWRSANGRLLLGHRRLAVIDPDPRSSQPMVSRCGRFAIAFNGEIYNYPELRSGLVVAGAELRTMSDTEVVLEHFAREGEAALARFVGMFALAIWDDVENALYLARDSYGIKPLYLADDGWTLRAASQVKALMAGGGVSRDPEPAGVVGFYLWGSVPEPYTVFQEVRALPPGHVIRVDANGPGPARPFLTLEQLYAAKDGAVPDDAKVREAVLASVRRHLVADVPVGLFLSSGIDSAALLAALHAIDPERAAATTAVTLGFEEYSGTDDDEVPLAVSVAQAHGARHVTRRVGEAEFHEDLPHILAAMDQPSIDGINTWFVSKAAAEAGLKVVLSGVGGDELFAGYPSFRDVPRWRRRLAVPARVPGLGLAWRKLVPYLGSRGSHPKLAGLFAHGGSWAGAYLLRRGLFLPHELKGILDPGFVARGIERLAHADPIGRLLSGAPRADIPRLSLMESGLYMRNQLLRDADWASMAHSVELRTPFVDVELLRAIRPMQRGLGGKDILAHALDLPEQIRNKPKTGFSTPVGTWMANALEGGAMREPWARSWARQIAAEAVADTAQIRPLETAA